MCYGPYGGVSGPTGRPSALPDRVASLRCGFDPRAREAHRRRGLAQTPRRPSLGRAKDEERSSLALAGRPETARDSVAGGWRFDGKPMVGEGRRQLAEAIDSVETETKAAMVAWRMMLSPSSKRTAVVDG